SLEDARTHYSLVVTPHADFAGRLKGDFSISQNFPNPVTTHTAFRFVLPQTWDAEGRRITKDFKLRIKVYDYSGREVAQVASGTFRPGAHTLLWRPTAASGSRLAKGAYIYRLETAGFRKSLKMLLE
ncbi:MAG TPA: FlgD immunoglobulin-like domain containing protein, partial [Fibrobacteria bacterium]|nr:FlgD immunoglobulin-like domain containing protein [Fibrobacteria bacterium]